MRITIINQFYVPDVSPTAHLAASLAEHLAARGHDVRIIASRGGYTGRERTDTTQPEEADAVRVHRVWTPQFGKGNMIKRCADYFAFYATATLRALTLPPQDLLIAMTTPPYIAWAAFLHRALHRRARIMIWNMDSFPEGAEYTGAVKPGSLPSRVMGAMNRFMFKRIESMVCLDSAMVDLNRRYEPPKRPLPATIIPNWERAAMFPRDLNPPKWEEADEPALKGRFVVLYLGNTGFGHQFDAVMEAADRLRGEPVAFLFVGGGQRWVWLEQQKRERRLDNVILHGYVPKEQTPSVMAAADCALITLRDAALGINSPSKVHANLAMGLPVIYIGPERSNVDEAVTRFDCGVSLRNGDADGIVAFIRQLLSDPSLRQTFRERARRAFESAYCDTRTLAQFDDLLLSIGEGATAAPRRSASEFPAQPQEINP